MNIGIFGGSFNPIHKGHVAIANDAINELGLDKLFFVPNFKSPFKSKVKYIDGQKRKEMINLVLPKKAETSTFEINRKGTSYTFETINHFKAKFPNDNLFLIIGTDNLYKLHKWKNINDIVSKAKIVVFQREGDYSRINVKKYDAILMKNELYKYSSTSFKKGFLENVEEVVHQYIADNRLYLDELIMHELSAKKYKHSVAVASVAAKYAKLLNVDSSDAFTAGMIHDIYKEKTNADLREFISKYTDEEIEDYNLHAKAGAIWAEHIYGIKNKNIINSIANHTSLSKDATDFDRVIYAADKLVEGRKWEGIQKVRIEIMKDFESGFKQLISYMKKFFDEKGIKVDEKTIAGLERWS